VDYGQLKLNLNSLPKRIMLRRRDDNELLNLKVGSAAVIEPLQPQSGIIEQFHLTDGQDFAN